MGVEINLPQSAGCVRCQIGSVEALGVGSSTEAITRRGGPPPLPYPAGPLCPFSAKSRNEPPAAVPDLDSSFRPDSYICGKQGQTLNLPGHYEGQRLPGLSGPGLMTASLITHYFTVTARQHTLHLHFKPYSTRLERKTETHTHSNRKETIHVS